MRMNVTGRHMEVTDAIRAYAEKKTAKLRKYHDHISEMEVILEGDGQRHKVEILVKADRHQPFIVNESGHDLYACLDNAVDKLERQLTKHKEISHHHKGRVGASEASVDAIEAHEQEL